LNLDKVASHRLQFLSFVTAVWESAAIYIFVC